MIESGLAMTSAGVPLRNDVTAALAGARADVDQPIGLPHQASSCSTTRPYSLPLQIAEGVDQPLVVARMQADRRLIEHVADADQAGADAGGQPDALQFAAGERVRGAVEREIVDADFFEKLPAGGTIS